jgi:CCR4-NOT transcriptional regulation complex NOT5 subunit
MPGTKFLNIRVVLSLHFPVYSKITAFCVCIIAMGKQTLEQLSAAFKAVEKDLSGRAADLAAKSSAGKLSKEERAEFEQIVRLNDLLSLLKLQAEQYWAPRIAS